MRAKIVVWLLLGLALLVGAGTTLDRYERVGQPFAGFMVMENLLVGVGGTERGGLQPFDLVRAVHGRVVESGREVQAEIAKFPAGTPIGYVLYRRGELIEADVVTRVTTSHDFHRFVLEALLPSLVLLALGALVFHLRPGHAQSWLFLTFCVGWYLTNITYADAHTTYRFTAVFLTSFAFSPALLIHLGLTFPQRRSIARRYPWIVWLPYALSVAIAIVLQIRFYDDYVTRLALNFGIVVAYWGLALLLLIISLARTSLSGRTPAIRQRARVLGAGFTIGYLPAVAGTAIEAVFRAPVPYLNELWRLNILFPVAVAYAMVRHNLFDLRAVVRVGTIYSAVTGLVVLAYAGAIALINLIFSRLQVGASPLVAATVVAVGVVAFLNPVYVRTQRVVDRLFFRERFDIQRSLERVSEAMISILDLRRIVRLMTETVEDLFHPVRQALLLYNETGQSYVVTGEPAVAELPRLDRDSCLVASLARVRGPLTRDRLEEDPSLARVRAACLAEMDSLRADLVVPVFFRDRVTGLLALGPRRAEGAYTTEDLRLLRLLMNQSAVALEHAKAYTALEAAHAELKDALRRVEILESIRTSLSKFVPKTVQALIEKAPDAPELAKREVDVSVLFVDIVGYTRLTERLDPVRVNYLIERYFGAFLDEILKRGGDVNETAGDGLMVVFQDPDPHRHARAAAKTAVGIIRRAREINAKLADLAEPIGLHVGVNSGVATVGATKIEGRTGTRWTYTASGQVTNVAARLGAVAEENAIIVGPVTRSRLATEFELEDLGERRLRNVEQPVRIFRLVAAADADATDLRVEDRALDGQAPVQALRSDG